MKRRQSVSYVWTHFDKSEQEATCKLCQKKIKLCGNTTNLREHLKRIHLMDNEKPSTSNSPTTEVEVGEYGGTKTKQTRLSSVLTTKVLNQKQTQNIDSALLQMVCVDYQPLQLTENKGFLKFIRTLQQEICGSETAYIPPSRKVLTQSILCKHYEEARAHLKIILNDVEYIAATTDIWTSDSNKSYITITGHCVYNDELQSLVLSTRELPSPHTGEHIAEHLRRVFEEFCILHKIVTIVSDNAQNMKKAINQSLQKHHHPCIAHTLNLSVKESLSGDPSLQNIIKKCKGIVSHFRHSAKSTEILTTKQKQMNMPILKLKQDIETRWNSISIMFARLCEVKIPLTIALTEIDIPLESLDNNEWKVLAECVEVLKNIEEITEQLSGEQYPTMGMVIPLIRGLQYKLNATNTETLIGTQVKETLFDVVQRRLGMLESNKHVAIACLLDPRFKKLAFGTDSNAANAQQRCIEELTHIRNSTAQTNEVVVTQTQQLEQVTAKPSIWDHFEQKKSNFITTSGSSSENIITLRQYLELPLLPRTSNPLLYWKSMKTNNPHLYKLYLKYSCIPATSVPSERIFSKAGQLTNLRRNRLDPKHLDYIIFLNANWKLFSV